MTLAAVVMADVVVDVQTGLHRGEALEPEVLRGSRFRLLLSGAPQRRGPRFSAPPSTTVPGHHMLEFSSGSGLFRRAIAAAGHSRYN